MVVMHIMVASPYCRYRNGRGWGWQIQV